MDPEAAQDSERLLRRKTSHPSRFGSLIISLSGLCNEFRIVSFYSLGIFIFIWRVRKIFAVRNIFAVVRSFLSHLFINRVSKLYRRYIKVVSALYRRREKVSIVYRLYIGVISSVYPGRVKSYKEKRKVSPFVTPSKE